MEIQKDLWGFMRIYKDWLLRAEVLAGIGFICTKMYRYGST